MGTAIQVTGIDVNIASGGIPADGSSKMIGGQVVNRATDTLPQTTAEALFTVAGGRVVIEQILGEVTTVIQTQANVTKLVANPTTGSDQDLCDTLDITAKAAGTLFGITGNVAAGTDPMLSGFAIPAQSQPCIVNTGTIDLDCGASNTGSVKWSVRWWPFDEGATLTATAV